MVELRLVIVTPDEFFNHPQWRLLMSTVSGQSQALTDLQTAVTALQTEGTDIVALVTSLDDQLEALLSSTSNADDPQVEAAAQAIQGTVSSLQALIAGQPSGVGTPPVQTPAPGSAPGGENVPPTATQAQAPTQ